MLLELQPISRAFRQKQSFQRGKYRLLPFNFTELDEERFVATNLVGDFVVFSKADLKRLIEGHLEITDQLYNDLKGRHFIFDDTSDVCLDLLATRFRTQKAHLKNFTALHIFVTTLRCDHSCPYCQVSRVSEDRSKFDMSAETADKAIELMYKSPSPVLKVEFQGGESLLNFDLIRHVVERASMLNDGRDLQFVIATNLSPLTDEMLAYCKQWKILVSTSLDGPAHLHNKNRPKPGMDSHERAVTGIKRVREALGPDSVGALMTTTSESLKFPEEIIDEYLRLGFRSIFLRSISPYGFAVRSKAKIGYETEQFSEFYKKGINYILELNRLGVPFREDFASIILQKALGSFGTGYVDLQSPAGAGTMVIVYNYDGDVYASDEARMLAEMNDRTFKIGNVHTSSYEELFVDSGLLETIHKTMAEGTPQCEQCAFLPWCGSEPVFHHATQGDVVGHRPTSAFCKKHMDIFRFLVTKMTDNEFASQIFRSWVRT